MKTCLSIAILSFVVLGAAACGSSVCSKAATANERRSACNTLPDGGVRTFNTSTCEQSQDSCTDADKRTLNRVFDCVNDIAVCTAGNEAAFDAANAECATSAAAELGPVSAACTAAIASGFQQ